MISGGCGAIGLSIAREFLKNGSEVVLLENNINNINKTPQDIAKLASIIKCDVTNKSDVKNAIATVVNIGVENNGFSRTSGLLGQTQEYFDETYMEYLSKLSNNTVTFTWYDGICHECDNDNCTFNDHSCHFDFDRYDLSLPLWRRSECIPTHDKSVDNMCMICNPSISQTNWSYDTSSYDCSPRFISDHFDIDILEGNSIIHDNLRIYNAYVPNEFYNVTFGYSDNYPFFNLNTTSGEITINGVFDYETRQNYIIDIHLLDNNVVIDTLSMNINIIDINETPVFSQQEYNFTIYYNSSSNTFNYTDELIVTAIDPDFLAGDSVTYHMDTSNLFTINSESGMITFNENTLPNHLNSNTKTFLVLHTIAKHFPGFHPRKYMRNKV